MFDTVQGFEGKISNLEEEELSLFTNELLNKEAIDKEHLASDD